MTNVLLVCAGVFVVGCIFFAGMMYANRPHKKLSRLERRGLKAIQGKSREEIGEMLRTPNYSIKQNKKRKR